MLCEIKGLGGFVCGAEVAQRLLSRRRYRIDGVNHGKEESVGYIRAMKTTGFRFDVSEGDGAFLSKLSSACRLGEKGDQA